MNEHPTLIEKRDQARQEILMLKDKMSPAVVFNFFSRWFPKSSSEQSLVYWLGQVILLNAVIILPGLLLASVFGEIKEWPDNIVAWFAAIELAIYGFLLSQALFRLTYHEIANHFVYKFVDSEDLSAIVSFCRSSASSTYLFLIVGGGVWLALSLLVLGFHGIGLTYMVIATGGLMGGGFQAIFWAISLTNQLKDFQYELNTFTPANSEVVAKLSSMLNKIIYLTGAFFVVLTLLVSSGFFGLQINKAFGLPLTFLGWGIIMIQFFVNRSAINEIVEKERWVSLNKLQTQMNTIQATEDLSNKDVSDRLLRLADFHERIRSNRAGGFDFKSLLSLFSQLMLPLLGLLLGNFDKVMGFFK
jgi:hypothetical protein